MDALDPTDVYGRVSVSGCRLSAHWNVYSPISANCLSTFHTEAITFNAAFTLSGRGPTCIFTARRITYTYGPHRPSCLPVLPFVCLSHTNTDSPSHDPSQLCHQTRSLHDCPIIPVLSHQKITWRRWRNSDGSRLPWTLNTGRCGFKKIAILNV